MVDGQDLGAKVQTLPYIHTCSLLPEQVSYNPSYYIRDKKYVKCIEREGERERKRENTYIYNMVRRCTYGRVRGCVHLRAHMLPVDHICVRKYCPSTIQASEGGQGEGGQVLALLAEQFSPERSGFGQAGTNKLTYFLTTGPQTG